MASKKVKDAMARAEAVDDAAFDPTAIAGDTPQKAARRKRASSKDKPEAAAEDDDDVGPVDGDDVPPPHDEDDVDRARHCSLWDQNDRDNARRLLTWFGTDLCYVSGMGWLTWRGTHWQRDEGDLGARLLAQNLVDKIKLEVGLIEGSLAQMRAIERGEAAKRKKSDERSEADAVAISIAAQILDGLRKKRSARLKFAISTGNSAKTAAMLQQAASLKSVAADLLDKNLHQFNVRNGTLQFVRRENDESDPESPTFHWELIFDPHRREDMNTKLAEVDYDDKAECPLFLKFIERTQPREIMQRFVQVFHAYALLIGGNDEQRLVFHYGTGANGKSAFLEALGRMAGSYRAVVSPDTLTGDAQRDGSKANSDIARLHSARFVTVEELPRGTPLKENLIKALTGGTRQVARFLQKENFEFDPIFTTAMSGNDMPTVSGTDYGMWRRLLIVHWGITIPEAERLPFGDLMKQFDAERPGILNWLIKGAMDYLNQGMAGFIPAEVTDFTDEYREERDNVGVFASACMIPMPGSKVNAGDAFKAYTAWCENNGMRPATQRSFGDRLNALGYKKKRGGYYVYLDVMLEIKAPDSGARAPPRQEGDPGYGEAF